MKTLEALDGISNFIEKYTGSEYNYSEPTGKITEDYTQIGEIFGFPVWMDDNKRYENEFLDFPSLSDILSSVANTGVTFDIKFGDCSVCLIIKFSIPLIEYPPLIICLSKPDCKKEEEKPEDCTPLEEMPEPPEGEDWTYDDLDKTPFNPACPKEDNPNGNDDNFFGDEGKSYRVEVWYSGKSIDWGAITTKTLYQGEVTNNYKDETDSPPRLANVAYMAAPIRVVEFNRTNTNSGCSNGGSGFSRSYSNSYRLVGKSGGLGIFVVEGARASSCDLDRYDSELFKRYDAGWGNNFADIRFFEMDGTPVPPKKKPPSPPIPDPPPMKDCCDELKKILARIEKQVKEIHKVLNPESFKKREVTVPSNLLYPTNDSNAVVMDDYADLIAASILVTDRKMGYFPQIVKIKDADPAKEGDQEINLVINSIADIGRLTLEYLIQSQGEVGATQLMTAAILYEAGMTHQLAVVNERKLQAISEYLDGAFTEKVEEFKMAFNPSAMPESGEGLDKYLPKLIKPHTQKVEVLDYVGGQSLKDKINEILKKVSQAAAAVTSTKPLDQLIEETQQLERLKRLLMMREFSDRQDIPDLKKFFDDSEKAYPSSNQSKEVKEKPYGFDLTNKPTFKKTTKGSKKRRYKRETKKK